MHKIERSEDFPSPANYNIVSSFKSIKESRFPFASSTKRTTFIANVNPG